MYRFTIFCLCLLLLNSCKKDAFGNSNGGSYVKPAPQLPDATQEGKNTIGFLMNGEVWLPYISGSSLPEKTCEYYKGTLNITANKAVEVNSTHNEIQGIGINFDSIYSGGIYKLNNWNRSGAFLFNEITGCRYQTDSISGSAGNLTLTRFDSVNRVMSGTFNVTFVKNGCDTIRITKGRFDFKYGSIK